jgi:alkylation response protein AidB-like acyl-CoA dehydrogenase
MVQKLIADMFVDVEAARLLVPRLPLCASLRRPAARSSLRRQAVLQRDRHPRGLAAIQIFGGYGYTRDYPVERIARDRLMEIGAGTSSARSSRASCCAGLQLDPFVGAV